jgi:hypothetical protein
MSTQWLIISDPPHGEVDHEKAAQYFGLPVAESRMKLNFPAPEIWLAGPDQRQLEEAGAALGECGVSSVLAPGQDLLQVPAARTVETFAFAGSTLDVVAGGELQFPFETPVNVVYGKPPAGLDTGPRKTGSVASDLGRPSANVMISRLSGADTEHTAAARENPAFIDLYATANGEFVRVSFVAGVTDFSSLESRTGDVLARLMAEWELRFSAVNVDRRLGNIRPRRRPMVGKAGPSEEKRRLFSYGTQRLSDLLGSISEDLRDLSYYELGSRLSFLIKQQAASAQ